MLIQAPLNLFLWMVRNRLTTYENVATEKSLWPKLNHTVIRDGQEDEKITESLQLI